MNIQDKLQKVKELEAEASKLRAEIAEENRKDYLPLLKEKAKISYGMGGILDVEIDKETLKKILEEQEETSWYHWGIEIIKGVTLRVDDNRIALFLDVSGTAAEMEKQKISIIKELGLKVDFSKEKAREELDLQKNQRRLERLIKLEREYNEG